MGYTTDFRGEVEISPALNEEQINYINTFSGSRRMKRDVEILKKLYAGKHGLGGSYGVEGEFFARDDGNCGQTRDDSILEHNYPPSTQPGLWCQWIIAEDGKVLEWDEGEKFYEYVKWLEYLIEKFFIPWGCILNGSIEWRGEDWDDAGTIWVNDNEVTTS